MPFGIDDFGIESGGTVMVAALGQVLTSRGTLTATLERGRCSGSEHVHALVPRDRADAAYLWRVLSTSPQAAHHVTGTVQLRQLSGAALLSVRIPWPDSSARASFVRALDELDADADRAAGVIPTALRAADEAYAGEVASTAGCRTALSEVCALHRGTDVPASLRSPDGHARVEGPSGGLDRCEEALAEGAAVVVGPSARRLLSHYVSEPSHPIAETAYVTAEDSSLPLPVLLFALRHAGLLDRLRQDGVLLDAPRLAMADLPSVGLALGTPEARRAFEPLASDAVARVGALEREVARTRARRDELLRAFFARPEARAVPESGAVPQARANERARAEDEAPVKSAEVPAAVAGEVSAAPRCAPALPLDETVALEGLAPLVRDSAFGLAPEDLAWELAPLVVLRRCLPGRSWARLARAARSASDDASLAGGAAGGVVAALDAGLSELAASDDLLAFLPNLSYASSLLSGAQLCELVARLDDADPETLSAAALRALLDRGERAGRLPTGALDLMAALAVAAAPDPDAVYVPVEGAGRVVDLAGRLFPAAMVRAQFADFSRMLAAAMVRAVETLPASRTRGGLGAAQGSALLDDEFADLRAPLVMAALPLADEPWCDARPAGDDPRWMLGTPPRARSEFAWIQHALAHQRAGGATVLLMRNGPLHSTAGSEPALRRALVGQRRVRCVASLPAGVFGGSALSCSVVVLGDEGSAPATLFVDALGLVTTVPGGDDGFARGGRMLAHDVVLRVAGVCRGWLRGGDAPDEPRFARVVGAGDVLPGSASLAPWSYV